MSWTTVTLVVFVAVGLLLVLLVLAQKGRGSGTLFGSSGHTLLGTKTGDVLTRVTAATFGVFVLLAALLHRLVG